MLNDLDALFGVSGSGGGSSKGSSSGSNESSNTLRSDNRAQLLELISEGPCLGLANGGTSIYLNETPVVNASGTANFRGVQWDVRHGTADQTAIPGNAQVETPFPVDVPVTAAIGPVVRSITDANTTTVRVVVQVDALAHTDSSGNIKPSSVSWAVEVAPVNGVYTLVQRVDLVDQKCSSPYQQATMVPMPPGGAPWSIRVSRLSPDSQTVEDQSATRWASYTEIVAGNFTYPHSAMVYLDIDADLFGATSIPTRAFDWYGLLVQIPSNYDPVKRTYSGLWDGTFNVAWSNNPAWIFYDLVTNDRYGLGQFIDPAKIDKWSLYQIAQYCDQSVPDGYGGTEPRYQFNGAITGRDEAYRVLQSITAAWRGMAFWSLGQVFATIDSPKDPIKLVTKANVVGGHFNYSGTSLKARHSVCVVTWNDPGDFYRPAKEVVINEAMLNRYGWRETSVQAIGCTSRSLAHRYGKWVLDTEQYETETVEYQASWDHAAVRPGDIIAVADPNKAGVRTGGRVALVGPRAMTIGLDRPFPPAPGQSYTFMVEGPDGAIQSRQIVSFVSGNSQVVLASPLDPAPLPNAMWVISGTDVNPRQYSVLSIKEDEQNLFTITALFHDPNKYARIEQGIFFNPIPYYRPKSTIKAPTNFVAKESLYQIDGHYASRILLSWTAGDDFQSTSYELKASTPKGPVDYGAVNVPAFDIENTAVGSYAFTLTAIGLGGQLSAPVTLTIDVQGWIQNADLYVSGLELQGQGADTTFVGQSPTIDWVNNFPSSGVDIAQDKVAGAGTKNPFYRDNVIEVQDADGNLLRSEVVTTDVYTYDYDKNVADSSAFGKGPQRQLSFLVQVRSTLGLISDPDEITVDNPVPDMVVPSVVGGLDSIFVTYEVPADRDFTGVLIWMDQNERFDPLATKPAYDGPNNAVSIKAENLKTYYIRMACYDAFGKDGLNISPPVEVFTGNRLFDIEPPAVPTGLSLAAQPITMPTGEVVNELVASWDSSPSDNFAYFSVEIREHVAGGASGAAQGGGNWISTNVDKPTFAWTNLVAGRTYDIQVRAFSVAGYPSNYAISAAFRMPAKTTPPGKPTAFTVAASLKSLFLQWVNPADADLDRVEVYQGTNDDFATASLVGSSAGQGFTVAGLTSGATLSFWIRAINTSGLGSGFVGPVDAAPGLAATADIQPLAIKTPLIDIGAVTTLNIAPLAITTPLIDASAITGTKIADGAISTPKLQAQVITADKMAANSVTTASLVAGAITSDKIAANQVTADKMAANSVTAVAILAGTITGDKIAANTIAANNITSATITGDKIAANTIKGSNIAALTITGDNIVGGSITGDRITAGTITGDRINVSTALPASITVGNTGVSIGSTAAPAALINSQTTSIQPGRILIGGSTYLSDWRNGTDATKIEGGAIAANTVSANKLTIGSRGITVSDLQFGYDKANNVVNWTAGVISWTGIDGSTQSLTVPGGTYQWNPAGWQYPCAYVAWQEGTNRLVGTMDVTQVTGASWVQLATYRGSNNLVATYGRTIIDGPNIVAGSISAQQLYVGQLITNAAQIDAGLIQNVHLAGAITFDKMAGGTLTATTAVKIGGDRLYLDAQAQQMVVRDQQGYNDGSGHPGRPRVVIGNLGGTSGTNYGIAMYAADGTLQMAIGDAQGINTHAIPGFGNLAAQNTVDYSQTTGFGTLSAQNTVDYSQMTSVGTWATVNKLSSGNAAQLIAANAISGTYISQLTCSKIVSGTVTANLQAASGSFDAVDPNKNMLRCRLGYQPGVDYGLFLWDTNGNLVLGSSGVTGTFVQDATLGTNKIVSNGVSVTAGAFAAGKNTHVEVSFSTDTAGSVLLTFAGVATVASGGSAYGYLNMDGNSIYNSVLVTATGSAVTVPMGMTYMTNIGAGTHTASFDITGGGAAVSAQNLSLTVSLFKR